MSTAALALKKLCVPQGGGSARRLLLWKKLEKKVAAGIAAGAVLLLQALCELSALLPWPPLKARTLCLRFPRHQKRQGPRVRHKWILPHAMRAG